MLSFLPHWLRGVLTLTSIGLSTITLFPLVILFALLKLIIPIKFSRKICTIILIEIANLWIGFNNLLLSVMHDIQWDIEGLEGLNTKDWYFVTCNHQSWADIPVVQKVLMRKIPMLKFFLKQELIWVPFIGIAWWALDFPFMKRYSKEEIEKDPSLKGKDLETTRHACEKFKFTPVTVFNFLEGTRFTEEKHSRQNSPYKYLLKPKAGGAAFVLGAMGDQLHTMLNITIHYPGDDRGFWSFMSGRIRRIVVRIQKVNIPSQFLGKDYMNDEQFRSAFQEWVSKLWQEKNEQLAQLHEQFPRSS
ncbi:acyltransferase [Hahella sp. CCB-MM4]|uniref:acyltransferase n=1 Tax=Hahella sp. (strain CCB-MM4) TaxID=1926491 RepID=UPI000B9AE2C0|nr:acyltransferase [Hahella sp. CCB-MM4]OZG70521.1 acyltransferase [Hahella sp. CCB-MM4]